MHPVVLVRIIKTKEANKMPWWPKSLVKIPMPPVKPTREPAIVTNEMIERAAPWIYAKMAHDAGVLDKFPWQPWGNSFMQDEARRLTRQVLLSALVQQNPEDRSKASP